MVSFSKFYFFIVGMVLLCVTGCVKRDKKIKSDKDGVSTQESIVNKYDTGKDRILNISSHIKRDVVPANKEQISYAQVKNIGHDLNVEKIAEYFDCHTVMGKAFLMETLEHPISTADTSHVLFHRKAIIAQLVQNPGLKEEIDIILRDAALQEQDIIEMMSDYFIGKTCPELSNLALLKKQGSEIYSFVEFCQTNSSMKTVSTVLNILGLICMPVCSVSLAITAFQNAQAGFSSGESAFWSGYFAVLTGVYAYMLHSDFSKAGEKRSKIHALNQLIYQAQAIEQICNQYKLENQFKMSLVQEDKQAARLVKDLKHLRYKYKKNYCFHTAGVHAFLYKIYQNDQHLAQLFASIAEMDAYNAIATKIIASKARHNKFCFAKFIKAEKPIVRSTLLWNLLTADAVPNSIEQDRHIILTGPNAGGKTTVIRSVLQNIILAQSYGIAAAETFELTQFDIIASYLNISDDIIRGDSLFAAEIKRAQEILQSIHSLSLHQKMFFALDELFTGTAAQQGEECAYEFIKKVASYDQVLSIYATHFNLLKDLGENNDALINYKVDAPTKNGDQKIVYPYTVSLGASDICVALDMARNAHLFA